VDASSINRAIRGARLPQKTDTSTDRLRALRLLWDAFTTHLQQELITHGRCALVARPAGTTSQLFVEDGEGHLCGAFSDPLGVAEAMLKRGLGRITCDATTGNVLYLETALLAVLGEQPEPVGDTGVFAVGERFVDGVTAEGLPDLPGISYGRTDERTTVAGASASRAQLDPAEFATRINGARSAQEIKRVLHTQVLPYRQGHELQPYLHTLMSAARHYNETRDAVAAAVELWTEAYLLIATDGDHGSVVAIMMSVARKRASADLPPSRRDVAGAIKIYEAIHGLDVSGDQNQRLVKTMMAVANLYTDLSLPPGQRDIPGAVALWESILGMGLPASEQDYVLRSMMNVANMLTDLRIPGRTLDVASAILIWRSACDHVRNDDDWLRTIRTMMAMANRLTQADHEPVIEDYRAAVRLWQATYTLCLERDEDKALRVVRTMMDVANHLTDFSGKVSDLELRGAIVIWYGLADCSALSDDRMRVIKTMMALAGQRMGTYSDRDSVRAALLLWHAAYRCAACVDDRVRVLKTIMAVAHLYPATCSHSIDVLRRERAALDSPGFITEVLAGLLYYQEEYKALIALVDDDVEGRTDTVTALRADAQRKLGQYHKAIHSCAALIRRCERPGAGRIQHEALVSALSCRGYTYLELGRTDAELLPRAEKDCRKAIEVAAQTGVPEPPRANSCIGYVCQNQGRVEEAEQAFARARQLDAGNRKAAEGLSDRQQAWDVEAPQDEPTRRKRQLMTDARQRNELHNDVKAAIACWQKAYALDVPGDDSSTVVAIMMSVAHKRANSKLDPEHRDVPGAARIYEAVFGLDLSPDQSRRVIRTMMAAANRFTDLSMPARQRDVPGAVVLWESLLGLGLPGYEDNRIVRTMMNVARMLTDQRVPGRELDPGGAAAIRRAVQDHMPDD